MKGYAIPSDIKQYVKKQMTKLLAKWLILTLAFGIIIFLINYRAEYLGIGKIPFFISLILLVSPFFITKTYKLFDKSYIGTVEKIKLSYYTNYDRNGYAKWNFMAKTHIERLTLYIKTKNGKIKQVIAFERVIGKSHDTFKLSAKPIFEHYKENDKVIHIAGTKYLQVVEKEQPHTVCTICGSLENSDNKICSSCGHTLKIKKSFILY